MKLAIRVHEELVTSVTSHIMIAILKKLEEQILIFKVIRGLMPSLEIVPSRRKILYIWDWEIVLLYGRYCRNLFLGVVEGDVLYVQRYRYLDILTCTSRSYLVLIPYVRVRNCKNLFSGHVTVHVGKCTVLVLVLEELLTYLYIVISLSQVIRYQSITHLIFAVLDLPMLQ